MADETHMGHLIAKLEAKIEQVLEHVERVREGIEWFLDPPPKEQTEEPEARRVLYPKKPDRRFDFGDRERLKELRPKAYHLGGSAYLTGSPKSANPYRDTRGGFRNAWFHGWEDARREQAQEQADED